MSKHKPAKITVSTPARRTREEERPAAFFEEAPWREHWWGMPSFVMGNAQPVRKITVNFFSQEDVDEFAKRLGIRVSHRSDSLWFPPDVVSRPSEWEFVDVKVKDKRRA